MEAVVCGLAVEAVLIGLETLGWVFMAVVLARGIRCSELATLRDWWVILSGGTLILAYLLGLVVNSLLNKAFMPFVRQVLRRRHGGCLPKNIDDRARLYVMTKSSELSGELERRARLRMVLRATAVNLLIAGVLGATVVARHATARPWVLWVVVVGTVVAVIATLIAWEGSVVAYFTMLSLGYDLLHESDSAS